jgi:DNA ligase-1
MAELVMLAQNYKGKDFGKDTMTSRKFDGKRVVAMKSGNEVIMKSRAMNPQYEAPVKHILEQINQFIGLSEVLDGELIYIKDGREDFQKGISLSQSRDRKDGCDNLYYVIFGSIRRNFFDKGENDTTKFYDNYVALIEELAIPEVKNRTGYFKTIYPNILIAHQYDYHFFEELRDHAAKQGWEGLMLRNGAGDNYEFRRSPNLLKVKKFKDGEFKIEDFKEGTGKYTGSLGAITILLPNGDSVDVGSGYTDEQRAAIWRKSKSIDEWFFDNIRLKVKYFEETTDRNGKKSLRFPTFIGFRSMQTTEDINIE